MPPSKSFPFPAAFRKVFLSITGIALTLVIFGRILVPTTGLAKFRRQ
jgi:hypothetical protein